MTNSSRIDALEKELQELKTKMGGKVPKVKKESKPREPSAYNLFVKEFIAKEKAKTSGPHDHKKMMKDAAAAWKQSK